MELALLWRKPEIPERSEAPRKFLSAPRRPGTPSTLQRPQIDPLALRTRGSHEVHIGRPVRAPRVDRRAGGARAEVAGGGVDENGREVGRLEVVVGGDAAAGRDAAGNVVADQTVRARPAVLVVA